MRTVDDIAGEVYNRFIAEALKRSDTFSFDIYWLTEKEVYDNREKSKSYPIGSIERTLYDTKLIPKLELELEIFKTKGISFIKAFEPYLLHKQIYEKEDTWFLRADPEALPLLLQPKSICNWRIPYFVDNIAFIRDGRYWFYTTTHSFDVNFSLDSLDEVNFWESIGIEFEDAFDLNEKRLYLKHSW